ncbi:hypothetical protein DUI87_01439 [Hirundo rustica rustica]|uniref:Core shell protein Gag P30 domain-containing protein n=1 Tax=Hirundo rustica rustica TaxID=333673 RepID=A0A3M0LNB5_HIRRU|nr:hypothetical protein DUI87_01439 [Hirundo rustica rustica]
METQKNTLAAKKMVYLTAGGNPVGRGEGRGVHLWAILVILSLAMYPTNGLPNPEGQMGQEKECLKETQREPTGGQDKIFKDIYHTGKDQNLLELRTKEIWERIAKGYQSDPIGVAKKMKFMIKQHSPDWADLQLLLDAITETEKQLVLKVAVDLAEDDCRTTQEDVKGVFPLQDPGWDPNDDEGLGRLKRYQELIVKGLERAIPKTINWSALYAIKQGPSQTPSEFLDHLRDAMCRHTTLDPGSDEGTQQLINLFLGQSTGDIRRKLQNIRGPNSQNLETLLDEAWRDFSNREEGYKQGMKKLAAAVKEEEKGKHGQGPPKQGPPRLRKDKCAFCKKFGH